MVAKQTNSSFYTRNIKGLLHRIFSPNSSDPSRKPVETSDDIGSPYNHHKNKYRILWSTPENVNLEEDGYEKAKANDGDLHAFELHLSQIVEGKKVEKNTKLKLTDDEKENHKQRNVEFSNEIHKLTSEINDIVDNQLPSEMVICNKLNSEIEEISTDKDARYLLGKTFNSTRFYISLLFLILLSSYLYMFYVSAIDSAFFRNIEGELKNLSNGAENISVLLNSIFNPNVLFNSGNEIYILLLAPFLFFGFGYSIHILYTGSDNKKRIGITLIICITFFSDSLIAYKIDKSINDIVSIVKLSDSKWVWYESVNFYIVLVMGFVGLIIWSIIMHSLMKEIDKKDISKLKRNEIDVRKQKINESKIKIEKLITQKNMNEAFIASHKNQIEHNKQLIGANIVTLETVLFCLDAFASGWIKYINETRNDERESKSSKCRDIVETVKSRIKQTI